MRPEPSQSGNAEVNRPPGEISGRFVVPVSEQEFVQAVSTAFCVAGCSATLVVE